MRPEKSCTDYFSSWVLFSETLYKVFLVHLYIETRKNPSKLKNLHFKGSKITTKSQASFSVISEINVLFLQARQFRVNHFVYVKLIPPPHTQSPSQINTRISKALLSKQNYSNQCLSSYLYN